MPTNKDLGNQLRQFQNLYQKRKQLFQSFLSAVGLIFADMRQSGIQIEARSDDTFTFVDEKYRFRYLPNLRNSTKFPIMLERDNGPDEKGNQRWVYVGRVFVDNLGNAYTSEADTTSLMYGVVQPNDIYPVVMQWLVSSIEESA
jgi:hypothetical protein